MISLASLREAGQAFIFVRPRYAGNVGSAARAMKNMGFSDLRLVQPRCDPLEKEARMMAVGAAPLLKKARVFDSLTEAVGDLHYVVGTSCRIGKRRRNFSPLSELPGILPKKGRVGIVFGPEEKGLTNEEAAFCQRVVTIPSDPRFSSLNLAQAVMVVAYELRSHLQQFKKIPPGPPL